MRVKLVTIVTRHFEFIAVYEEYVPDTTIAADFIKAWKGHCKAYPSAEPNYANDLVSDISIRLMPLNKWHRDGDVL